MRPTLSILLVAVMAMATQAQQQITVPIQIQADPIQVAIVPEVTVGAAAVAPIASAAAPLPMEAAPIASPDCNRCGGEDALNLVHVKDGVTTSINVKKDLGPLRRFIVKRIAKQRVRRLRR